MMQLDAIWHHARTDLVITNEHGDQDLFLWEHTVRVTRNARRIATLPTVQAASPDEAAIIAAALYHDAGWITRLQEGEIERAEILCRPASEAPCEQGAAMLERRLVKLLPADSLARASEAIRTLNDREIDLIEGQVVREADNLDGFGALSLWPTIRRGAVDGKGVQAVIDTWHAQKEYRFWKARLRDSFQFAPIRALAEKRLKKFERFMEELEQQHQGADLVCEKVLKPTHRKRKSARR
ncbi:MAG: HD domain-containing protein [Phycisphaerae bacterium]